VVPATCAGSRGGQWRVWHRLRTLVRGLAPRQQGAHPRLTPQLVAGTGRVESVARTRNLRALACFSLLLVLLSGCGHWTDTATLPAERLTAYVYGTRTVGQTFTCRHAGLDGISVLLSTRGTADIVLHLRAAADSTTDIATSAVSPSTSGQLRFQHFALPVQDDVNGKSFYVLIESPGAGADAAVAVPYVLESSSPRTLHADGAAAPGSVSFQLHYNSLYIVKDLGRQAVSGGLRAMWLLFLSACLFLLPGGAAVVWLVRWGDWTERLVAAAGLSVAINALVVYATMTGLRLSSGVVIGLLVLCAILIGARWTLAWRRGLLHVPTARTVWRSLKRDPPPAVLLCVTILVLGTRLFVVRDLVAPMWGDSYQHTVVSQLMVENGGLFDSWEPYAPLKTLTYHFGFHANVALFHWLSNDSVIHSVIWVGQILNVLAVLTLYPLTVKMSHGNRWAGVGAVLVAGLFSAMPMYYVNWGRYTQLAGQAILPVAVWLTWHAGEQARWDWRLGALLALALTGMGITHYRIVLVYGVFAIAWGMVLLVRRRGEWRAMRHLATGLALTAGLVLLLFLPWGVHTFSAKIPELGKYLFLHGHQSTFHSEDYNAIGDPYLYVSRGLLALSLGGFASHSLRKRSAGWVLLAWVAGLLLLANPYVLRLPGTGVVNNFAVFISFYIPVGMLAGSFLGEVAAWLGHRWRGSIPVLIAVASLAAGWGAFLRVRDLQVGNALVTQPDMEAMGWIRGNVPVGAKFLVNGFTAYGGTLVVGSDAGWWIPLLTGRQNTIPPLLYGTEAPVDPQYREMVLEDLLYLEQVTPTSADGICYLRNRGVTHVYVGEMDGRVGTPPPEPLLEVNEMQAGPAFEVLYSKGKVRIFRLSDMACRTQ